MQLKHWPTHPLQDAVARIGLADDLHVTAAEPAAEMFSVAAVAPAKAVAASRQIYITACAGWLTVHVRQHPREVCTLSGGVMSQPVCGPLQTGFRLLPRPLPAAPSARLPSREGYGLTTLRR